MPEKGEVAPKGTRAEAESNHQPGDLGRAGVSPELETGEAQLTT